MSLAPIIARRRDALIKAWVEDPLVQVQVEAPDDLPRLAFIADPVAAPGPSGALAHVGALGRRDAKNVAVIERGGNPDVNASVWVSAQYSSYKAAYVAFINKV